jgi:26S proteasome regulatory subunit N10
VADYGIISQLALKHRQNKSQRQRIIVFTCSPISDDEKSLIKLAKRMKKTNISVDFIAFGDLESETKSKLQAFSDNVKGGDGSHLVTVPPGPNLLSDALRTSPVLAGEGATGAGGSGGGDNGVPGAEVGAAAGAGAGGVGSSGFEFGIDPSVDPELAMALRMSMEEETNRLERQRREREEAEQKEKEKERLEGIPEEGTAQGSAADAGEESSAEGAEKKDDDGKKDRKDDEGAAGDGTGAGADPDKMDTA